MTPEADGLVKLAIECGANFYPYGKDGRPAFTMGIEVLERFASLIAAQKDAPVQQALTDEQKRELLNGCGFITGANFETLTGRLYRSLGTPSNVWEVSLFELIDRARVYPPVDEAFKGMSL